MSCRFRAIALVTMLCLVIALPSLVSADVADEDSIEWVWARQFGTDDYFFIDEGNDVAACSSGSYIVGRTYGTLPGQIRVGNNDAFIRKYDPSGGELWTRQFGSVGHDYACAVSTHDTGVYVAGRTNQALPGQENPSPGCDDIFLRKYNHDGNELWTRQFGSLSGEMPRDVCSDALGVYVAGRTQGAFPGQTFYGYADAFVCMFDHDGNQVWTRQFATTEEDNIQGVFADASGVYVVGTTAGVFPTQVNNGNHDCFIRKYDHSGSEVWTRQFGGTGNDAATAVFCGPAGIYVAGDTHGISPSVPASGYMDAFIRLYDYSGNVIWTDQYGASDVVSDSARAIYVDSSGAYVTGYTNGAYPGYVNAGSYDSYICKYNHDGTSDWTFQFGTSGKDYTFGLSAGPSGEYYTGGSTNGVFPGQTSAGDWDAFILKLRFTPPNSPPVALAGGPYCADESATVVFDGAGSSDPDNDELMYRWYIDGSWTQWSSSSTATHTWYDDFSGTVTLEVSDGQLTDSIDTEILISNSAPEAYIDHVDQPTPDFVLPGDVLIFTGIFFDPGVLDSHTLEWDFGDGNHAQGLIVSHIYTTPGIFIVTLIVSDDDGGFGVASLQLEVSSSQDATHDMQEYVLSLPDESFWKNPDQRGEALRQKLQDVIDLIEKGYYHEAAEKLLYDIRPKTDGLPAPDDWIIDSEAQQKLCRMIDAVIAYLVALV